MLIPELYILHKPIATVRALVGITFGWPQEYL